MLHNWIIHLFSLSMWVRVHASVFSASAVCGMSTDYKCMRWIAVRKVFRWRIAIVIVVVMRKCIRNINISVIIFTRHHITLKRSNFLLIYLRKRMHLLFYFIRTLSVLQFGLWLQFKWWFCVFFLFLRLCWHAHHESQNQNMKRPAKENRVQIKIKNKETEENNTATIQCGTHIAVNQFIPHEN